MPVTYAQPITALSEREQEFPLVADRARVSCDCYRCACGVYTATVPDLKTWECSDCGATMAERAVLIARVRNDSPKETP